MKFNARSSFASEASQYSETNHVPILRMAIVAWLILSVLAAAVVFLQNRSNGNSISNSEMTPLAGLDSSVPGLRSQSCSTSSCHGSFTEDPLKDKIRSDEYFVWLDDPHARAFRVLTEERSRKIFQNLGVADDHMKPLKNQEDAFQRHWRNCLGCHDSNQHLRAVSNSAAHPAPLSEGVSCESCHGDSSTWLHQHYRSEWRESVSNLKKRELGLISAVDLTGRINQCATCHVGSDLGEVNHDLIAAGHPALRFEYTWYQSRLPRHWKTGRDSAIAKLSQNPKKIAPGNPAQTWLIGQLVTSISAIEQLERRIEGNDLQTTIPELAEYNCFACHHDLRGTSWKQNFHGLKFENKMKPQSILPWGNWNLVLMPTLADQYGSRESQAFSTAFRRLQQGVETSVTSPKAGLLELTRTTRATLKTWLISVDQSPYPDTGRLVHRLSSQQSEQLISSWEQTANILLGFAATYRLSSGVPAPLQKAMDHVRFPDLIDSPETFLSSDSVPGLSREQWIELLNQISNLPDDGLSR